MGIFQNRGGIVIHEGVSKHGYPKLSLFHEKGLYGHCCSKKLQEREAATTDGWSGISYFQGSSFKFMDGTFDPKEASRPMNDFPRSVTPMCLRMPCFDLNNSMYFTKNQIYSHWLALAYVGRHGGWRTIQTSFGRSEAPKPPCLAHSMKACIVMEPGLDLESKWEVEMVGEWLLNILKGNLCWQLSNHCCVYASNIFCIQKTSCTPNALYFLFYSWF